jgi:hypothetical protein
MATKKTEQNMVSENMAIATGIAHDTYLLWEEDHKVAITCLNFLFDKVTDPNTDPKLAVSVAEFLADKFVPDPVKKADITSGGRSLEVVINTNLDFDETEV